MTVEVRGLYDLFHEASNRQTFMLLRLAGIERARWSLMGGPPASFANFDAGERFRLET